MSDLPIVARWKRYGLVGADLSKTQDGDEILFLHFFRVFLTFFKKIMTYVEYPEFLNAIDTWLFFCHISDKPILIKLFNRMI